MSQKGGFKHAIFLLRTGFNDKNSEAILLTEANMNSLASNATFLLYLGNIKKLSHFLYHFKINSDHEPSKTFI